MRLTKKVKSYRLAREALADSDYKYAIRRLRKLARKKYGDALNDLGTIYSTPFFVKKDLKKALRYYLLAYKCGSAMAAYNLSLIYLVNDDKAGIRADLSLARHYAEDAYSRGVPFALYGNLPSPKDADISILSECADYIPDAKYHYAMQLLSSDTATAISLLKEASDAGHVLARYELARRYEEGLDGVNKDESKAKELYDLIKEVYPPAAYRLAEILRKNNADRRKMLECYEMSANTKYAFIPGMAAYAEILQNGAYGVTRSPARAQKYIDCVMEGEDAKSAFALSGKLKNVEKRENLIKKSADAGYLPAVIAYAEILDKRNRDQASQYYLKGAYLGNAGCQYEIAIRYLDGVGIEKNRNACLYFLEKAVSQNHHGAIAALGKLLIKDKSLESRERGYNLLNQEKDIDLECYYYLGKRYLELFDETNLFAYIQRAEESFLRAVAGRVLLAYYELGKMYVDGNYVQRDVKKGIRFLKEAEKGGVVGANCLLSEILLNVGQISNAKVYISPALSSGNPEAEYIYGKILLAEGNDEGKRYIESSARKGVERAKAEYLTFGWDEDFISTIVEELAKKGDKEAIRRHIPLLKGVKGRELELLGYLTILSEEGDKTATLELAEMYEQGKGVVADPYKAKALYERVDSGVAYLKLAEYYEFGIATEPDMEKAAALYEKAAEEGLIEAVRICASFALEGYSLIPPDKQKAIKYLRILEEKGDVNAMFSLYKLLKEEDEQEAINKLAKSAEGRNPNAKVIYASYLIGKNENTDLAFDYVKECSAKKMADAYYLLGYCYENGIGTKVDNKKAFEYYHKGAEKGCVSAIKKVAYCYANGIGVKANEDKANAWSLRASLSNPTSELYI